MMSLILFIEEPIANINYFRNGVDLFVIIVTNETILIDSIKT